jgi:hypothetical protein
MAGVKKYEYIPAGDSSYPAKLVNPVIGAESLSAS